MRPVDCSLERLLNTVIIITIRIKITIMVIMVIIMAIIKIVTITTINNNSNNEAYT